jgi:hypothetical protein
MKKPSSKINEEVAQLSLNRPQLRIAAYLRFLSGLTAIWPRGVGKSFMIAYIIRMIVRTMPGSTWAIQGSTFIQLLTMTLPGTLDAITRLGYHQNFNYVFGKKCPDGWTPPYRKLLETKHSLIFHAGYDKHGFQLPSVCFQLISQDRESSGRGPSFDGVIVDEALTINQERFVKTTKAAIRGNRDRFGNLPYHHAQFSFSSMPYGTSADHLIKRGDYYLDEHNYNFRKLMNDLINLQVEFLREKDKSKKLLIYKNEIIPLQSKIRFFPDANNFMYSEASGFENISVLGLNYIQSAFDESVDLNLFLVEYLNKLIGNVEGLFYAALDPNIHGYNPELSYDELSGLVEDFEDYKQIAKKAGSLTKDCVSNHPLELGLDFGKVNWVVVAQHFQSIKKINYINAIYVKSPKIIDDLALEFVDQYASHERKVVHVWPDGMGNDEVANAKMTYTQQFCNILKKHDWICIVKQKSKKNPEHHYKYLLWNRCLANLGTSDYPTIAFNRTKCKTLLFAMSQTGTVDHGNSMIGKDKSSEKALPLSEREKATDSTDAADQILYGLYKHLVIDRTPKSLAYQALAKR